MDIFGANRVINRLNKMIDNAIEGKQIENGFDETKMSALETRLAQYLMMNNTAKYQIDKEKVAINQLISDISHQTKTPIANILLYLQLLDESVSIEDKNYINLLIEQTEKLNFLISELIKTSRLETGIITTLSKRGDIQTLIDNVIRQATPKMIDKNIIISFNRTDITAMFDTKWTTEAIYNIVDNAIKYTHCGGSIIIRVISYEFFCKIDIIDKGIGISENDITKIFKRFYRSASTSQDDGVGIVLYIAREIVTSQGGYIKVKSKIGEGSTFSIFLPKA